MDEQLVGWRCCFPQMRWDKKEPKKFFSSWNGAKIHATCEVEKCSWKIGWRWRSTNFAYYRGHSAGYKRNLKWARYLNNKHQEIISLSLNEQSIDPPDMQEHTLLLLSAKKHVTIARLLTVNGKVIFILNESSINLHKAHLAGRWRPAPLSKTIDDRKKYTGDTEHTARL